VGLDDSPHVLTSIALWGMGVCCADGFVLVGLRDHDHASASGGHRAVRAHARVQAGDCTAQDQVFGASGRL
jgi:hypothetical protein